MTVYVDDHATLTGSGDRRWAHLMADTEEELQEFARALGAERQWARFPGTWRSHYNVTPEVRLRAIELGAVRIGFESNECVALLERKRRQEREALGKNGFRRGA